MKSDKKKNTKKMNLMKIRKYCISKDTIKKVKGENTD